MIYCITHKKVDFIPSRRKGYALLQVGGKNAVSRVSEFVDDTGSQISEKNSSFCELTGLYWIWKNQNITDDSIVGLVHYRRFFVHHIWWPIDGKLPLNQRLVSIQDADKILEKYDIILPEKYSTNPYTVKGQYTHWHYQKDLDCVRDIICKKYPDYMVSFDSVMEETELHPFNMFIMRGVQLNSYCEWLFSILFEAEKRIDITDYNKQQKRVFGFLAERLLNVYVKKNQMNVKVFQVFLKEDA